MIATLVGPVTVGQARADRADGRARRPAADRTDIDASLAITTSVMAVMRPRGKVYAESGESTYLGAMRGCNRL